MNLSLSSRSLRTLRLCVKIFFGFSLAVLLTEAQADTYPTKPIRLVIPFAAGSATDSAGRVIAQALSARLGQSVIVDNRAGANGQIAAVNVAQSKPDGYTIFMTTNSTHGANSFLYRSLAYDPMKDFDPVVRIGTLPFMLVVHPDVPAKNMREFLDYARENSGKLSYGTSNTTSLVCAEMLNVTAQAGLVGVSYKSSQQAILDLVAGRLHVMIADFAIAMPQVKAGKLRALAVTPAKGSRLVPDVPPLARTLPDLDVTSWNGLFVPAGTPREIIDRIETETLALLAQPEIAGNLATIGYEVDPMGRAQFSRYVPEQIARWGTLIRAANIQPE
ncbi:MAG: tripartite tricarboxylate transporter substrate binding protein [Burkholderiales bacterium]